MAVGQWRCRRGPEERTAKAAARPASESSTLSLTASAFAAAARPVSDSSTLPFAAAAASFASPANAATFASSALANAATLATAALVSSDSMVSFTFAAALAASDRAQSIRGGGTEAVADDGPSLKRCAGVPGPRVVVFRLEAVFSNLITFRVSPHNCFTESRR